MAEWIGQFDGSLEVCPPVSEEFLHSIPSQRGVLLLLAEGNRPLILVTAADLRGRLRARLLAPSGEKETKRQADWRQVTRKVLWKLTDSPFETDLCYLEAARQLWPEGFAKLLAWRPAWFVHVDPAGRAPHFAKVARLLPPPGLCLGPFRSARLAQGFINIIQDAFDLCRDSRRLARAPYGRPCSYRQMGRCLGVCDGTIDMDTYRAVVAKAAAFAAGERESFRSELAEEMKQAAGALRFEEAAALKARLARLAELDGPAYASVIDGQMFQFLLVQRSGSRKAAKVFLADRGLIARADPLCWPLKVEELQRTLDHMAALVRDDQAPGRYDPWRVALVASYLLGGPQRKGLILRWREDLTPQELGVAIEPSAAALGLGRLHRIAAPQSPPSAYGQPSL